VIRTDLPFDSLNYGQAFIRTTFPVTDLLCNCIAVIIFISNRPIHAPWSNVTHEIYRQLNLPSKLYFECANITSTFVFILLIEILVFSSWNIFYYLSAISKEIIPPRFFFILEFPCITSLYYIINQQDATLAVLCLLILQLCSRCFGRSLRPSSGAL